MPRNNKLWRNRKYSHRKVFRKNAVIRINAGEMPYRAVCETCDNLTLHYIVKGVPGLVCSKQISGLRLAGHRVVYE